MATSRFADHLLTGIHSARPAANAVPAGSLYSCTTHGLIYQSDGSSTWSTYATLGGAGLAADTIWDTKGDLAVATAADTASKLAAGANTKLLTADSSQSTGLKWQLTKDIQIKVIDDATVLTTGDGKIIFCIPAALGGCDLTAAHAFVTTVSSSGLPTVQIRNITQTADMLTTKISIDASEFTSYTAATAPVVDTGNDDVATGDLIAVDVDVAGTGAKGLGVILTFTLPLMAYRFSGSGSSYVRFGIGPFNGYTFGALTFAAFYKATDHADQHDLIFLSTSALNSLRIGLMNSVGGGGTSRLEWADGSKSVNGLNAAGTTNWYLIVITCPGGAGNTIRAHVHNGTSWSHANMSGDAYTTNAIASTDKIFVNAPSGWGGNYVKGDVVCVGIKKADSNDATVETLSPTSFGAWGSFGFDWLVGFESSSSLVNRASPGSGGEDARGTISVVSDPAGWSWAGGGGGPTFVPQIVIT